MGHPRFRGLKGKNGQRQRRDPWLRRGLGREADFSTLLRLGRNDDAVVLSNKNTQRQRRNAGVLRFAQNDRRSVPQNDKRFGPANDKCSGPGKFATSMTRGRRGLWLQPRGQGGGCGGRGWRRRRDLR